MKPISLTAFALGAILLFTLPACQDKDKTFTPGTAQLTTILPASANTQINTAFPGFYVTEQKLETSPVTYRAILQRPVGNTGHKTFLTINFDTEGLWTSITADAEYYALTYRQVSLLSGMPLAVAEHLAKDYPEDFVSAVQRTDSHYFVTMTKKGIQLRFDLHGAFVPTTVG